MRKIDKGASPAALSKLQLQFKQALPPRFRHLTSADKAPLREALSQEQRGLCAYCEGHFSGKLTIEHWTPQAQAKGLPKNAPDSSLEWENLLGCCAGNGDAKPVYRHCGAHKGSATLHHHPAKRPAGIRYLPTGRVQGSDQASESDLRILNLNAPTLVASRKAVLNTLKKRRPWASQAGGSEQERIEAWFAAMMNKQQLVQHASTVLQNLEWLSSRS